jgi:hypothetical protein
MSKFKKGDKVIVTNVPIKNHGQEEHIGKVFAVDNVLINHFGDNKNGYNLENEYEWHWREECLEKFNKENTDNWTPEAVYKVYCNDDLNTLPTGILEDMLNHLSNALDTKINNLESEE